MPRGKGDYEYEERRIAERLRNIYGKDISDRASFDLAFTELIDSAQLTSKQKGFRDKVFKRYADIGEVQTELEKKEFPKQSLFEKAGGKDFKKDRQKTAKTVVKNKKEYVRRGARKVDLKNYDTKKSLVPSRIKKKVVYSYKTYVRIKNKVYVRYRDKMGRFASVRKK